MTSQMEVFLQENTNTFIESLFTTLQNGDYVEGPPKVVARKADADDLVRAHHMFSRIFLPTNMCIQFFSRNLIV